MSKFVSVYQLFLNVSNQLHPSLPSARLLTAIAILGGICLFPIAAISHHPLEGATPQNFIQGFLSGLGHPILGIYHFCLCHCGWFVSGNLQQRSFDSCCFCLNWIGRDWHPSTQLEFSGA